MTKFTLAVFLCLMPLFKGFAQNSFNFDNPEGTYVITDYLKHKITLKLNKGKSSGILTTKGTGTITINGRTLNGTWNRFDDDPYIAFNTYNNVKISYALPSGSAKTDQIVISADGRASYNSSELMKNDGDWISVRKQGIQTKAPVASNKTNALKLADFIKNRTLDLNIDVLKNKGFSMSDSEDGGILFKKGSLTIEYSEDFGDDGEGSKSIRIKFPDMSDAYDFVKPLMSQKGWKMSKANFGEFFRSANGSLTVYREIDTVEITHTFQ